RLYVGTLVVNPTAAVNNLWTDVGGNVDGYGAVWKSAGPGSFDMWWNGGMYLEEGQLAQFGDWVGGETVIRYTVPSFGLYDINAHFTGQDQDNTYGFTKVDVNGVNVFQGELYGFYGKSANNYSDRSGVYEQSYFATRSLAPGDTVDFVVAGRGSHMPVDTWNYYECLVGTNHFVTVNPNGVVVSGVVTSSAPGNAPVAGATVKTSDGYASVTTDSNGHYTMALFAGTYTITTSKRGFFTKTEQLVVPSGSPLQKGISIDPWPATRWDAAADFSTTNNPSGPWSYGTTRMVENLPPLQTFLYPDLFAAYSGALQGWTYVVDYNEDANGKVAKNVTSTRVTDDQWMGLFVYEPNQLCVGPGAAGWHPISWVRWTAPQATDVRLYCRFSGQKDILRSGQHAVDATVKVLKNGTELFSGAINGFGGYEPDYTGAFGTGEQVFETLTTIHVAQGDTIDFAVNGNQDYTTGHYESVGLDALVLPMSAAPVDVGGIVGLRALDAGTNVNMITPQAITVATGTFSDGSCFIEEVQRTAGIRVVPGSGINLQLGHRIKFTGTVQVAGGEKYITINSLTSDANGIELDPLGMTVKSLVAYSGPNTANLLVRVWGTVSNVSGGYATIDDGSNLGVRVKLDGLVSPITKTISVGKMIGVSGPASNASGILTIRPRSDDDIVIFGP
ncbi:MAG: carboxypeptidase-like regulatory domain-containing protein, partial [Armatimonadota bacterium]